MNKYCPMKGIPCTHEKCAWYLVHSKQCAIPLIASQLQNGIKMEVDWGA